MTAKPHPVETARVRAALLAWYRAGHRAMPWRETRDAYAIWVSEVMLQQTQVATALPYYQRWMARFPTVRALAQAPLEEVLAHWAGLGYYARARNLHLAAGEVLARYDGELPRAAAELRTLPGVGRYTAGAVASAAWGEAAAVVDGNVARVLARLYLVDAAVDLPATQSRLWELAEALLPRDDARDFNQALMELGATVCRPAQPRCAECPLARECRARAEGRERALPYKRKKRAPPTVEMVAVVLRARASERELWLRRPPRGLWGGLWEPPAGERADDEAVLDAAYRIVDEHTSLRMAHARVAHAFLHPLTHRSLRFTVVSAETLGEPRLSGYDAARWCRPRERDLLPVAAWTRYLAAD